MTRSLNGSLTVLTGRVTVFGRHTDSKGLSMKNKFNIELLRFLSDALQKPVPKREHGLYSSVIRHAARDGWVSFADIEDIICETDPRLYGVNTKGLAEALEIPVRSFFPRPRSTEKNVFGYSGFEIADAAALLIAMRRFGFSIDPQPLVDLSRPALKKKINLNEAELTVFWFQKERDRFAGFTIGADDKPPRDLRQIEFVTETGHRVELCVNQDENPWLLSVLPPKRSRKRLKEAA